MDYFVSNIRSINIKHKYQTKKVVYTCPRYLLPCITREFIIELSTFFRVYPRQL